MRIVVSRCPHNLFRSFDFMNFRVENVCSSSTLPNTAVTTMLATFMYSLKQESNSELKPSFVHNFVTGFMS
jgi:hypothetical protein